MNSFFFLTLMWYRSWYFLRGIAWELVYDIFRKKIFCIKKVLLPASSADAASDSDTKFENYIGIGT